MRTNKEILDSFLSELDKLHDERFDIPFQHTLLNHWHGMFHRDWRDFCDHDDCVDLHFQTQFATLGGYLVPNSIPLHRRIADLMLNALSEMAGKNVGDDAEEFLRNL